MPLGKMAVSIALFCVSQLWSYLTTTSSLALVENMIWPWLWLVQPAGTDNITDWISIRLSYSPWMDSGINSNCGIISDRTQRNIGNAPVPLCRIYCRMWTNIKSLKFPPILLCEKVKWTKSFFSSVEHG